MTSNVTLIEGMVVPSYHRPPCLSSLAAGAVARCLTYEDYEECNHYRWDPVMIWQYELPQKKKKSKKSAERSQIYNLNDVTMPVPQPQWQEMKKFRDWWWNKSTLGSVDSVLRAQIVNAFEQLSWTSKTEEEFVLFLLLRLCVDTRIELGGERFEILSEWCGDLAQVITRLGPYPLQKLFVTDDKLGIKPVLTALVQQSPNLQVLKMNQWALSNDFMMSLGSHCRMLTEFSIPHMQPQVFMSDEALFACFFDGMSSEEVVHSWKEGTKPRLSFSHLRYVDILYWKQTERFIQMLCVFYPSVRFCGIDAYMEENEKSLVQPFLDVGAQVTALRVSCRTKGILDERLRCLVNRAPFLRELRLHVDDNFKGADCDSVFERRLEEAGAKLCKLVSQMSAFESLALRPYEEVDITKVVLPTLHAQGSCITSLHICYEYAQLNSNTLYQLINLCPRLYFLAVSMAMSDSDDASKSYRWDIPSETDATHDSDYTKVVDNVLRAAPNLEMLGLSCALDMEDDFALLSSDAVQTLHLQFCCDLGSLSALHFFLQRLLPNFPNLRTLSLDERDGTLDSESLAPVCRGAINVTRWKPEFFQLPKWDSTCGSHNTFSLYVM
ncbi:hypothetical protein Hamer_G015273 [Homarus americanus]|uniref:Uncharacterized protein n=1 Tax=Homarus americanus TaxID=6706 RepID=A0A8J5N7D3_HOMAM|nr:hypothetical protein Hamer_G015273 [Homarus americanus]